MISSLSQKHNSDSIPIQFNQAASVGTDFKPSIVITAGLNGIAELRIVADESSTQEILQHALRAVGPILDQLHESLISLLRTHPNGAEN